MITTTSLVLWYLCIGCLVSLRVYQRTKKYIPALCEKYDKEDGGNDYSFLPTESIMVLAIFVFGTLSWPSILLWGWKLIFTERYPFKVPIEEDKNV